MENPVLNADSEVSKAVERGLRSQHGTAVREVQRLVRAAFEVITEQGKLDPHVSQIVRASGLSNKAFYRHFPGKHALIVAVLDEGVTRLASYLAHRMENAETPADAIGEWVRGFCAQALDVDAAHATRPFVGAHGRLADEYPEAIARIEARLTELARDALARGLADGSLHDVDPVRDAEALYHVAMGWLEDRLRANEPATAEDAAQLESFALRAIGCRGA